jgi:hypothetical protein
LFSQAPLWRGAGQLCLYTTVKNISALALFFTTLVKLFEAEKRKADEYIFTEG